MKLVYSVSEADALAYASYFYEHSPVIQNQMKTGRVVLFIAVLLFAFITVLMTLGGNCVQLSPLIKGLLYAAIVLGVAVVIVYFAHKKIYLWSSRKMLRSGKNKGIFGPQSMEITDTGLKLNRPGGESTTYWNGIERVETTEIAAYIYISSMAAYIVPRASVTEGNFDSFLAEIRKRVEGSTGKQ